LVRKPTSSLAFSSTLWFSDGGSWLKPVDGSAHPLFDLSVPPESYPVDPSRPGRRSDADRLLSWAFAPFNTYRQRGSTRYGPRLTRYVPSSGFGCPLDGLRPSEPGRACFIPTAFLGFLPSKPSPLERWLSPSCERPDPPAVSPPRASAKPVRGPVRRTPTSRLWPFRESLVRRG
jgi:hypothetical protein